MSDLLATAFDERTCLQINPFEGDFGTPGDKVLSDKIVTGRSNKPCVECLTPTAKGERVRTMTAIFDGELHTYRWCAACCAAFVAFGNGDYAPMDTRAAIRRQNSGGERLRSAEPRSGFGCTELLGGVVGGSMEISTRIQQLQRDHGGLRAAARAVGMSPSYMIRLRDGEKLEPSERLLRKLGLKKKVTYVRE